MIRPQSSYMHRLVTDWSFAIPFNEQTPSSTENPQGGELLGGRPSIVGQMIARSKSHTSWAERHWYEPIAYKQCIPLIDNLRPVCS